jgi:hypothetical protein
MKSGFQVTLAFFLLLLIPCRILSKGVSFADRDCLKCHGSGLELGFKVVPPVDAKDIRESVHAEMRCVGCHTGIQALPHEGKMAAVDCRRCHKEEYKEYTDSVHGRAYLAKGETEAPACYDCHGKHRILSHLDPASTVYRSEIPKTCARCHENMAVVEKYNIKAKSPYTEYSRSVHGRALMKDGLIQFAAVCTDCHGIHEIEGKDHHEVSAHRPETCGKCHTSIFEVYRQSIHGVKYEEGNRDVAVCVDCHGEHSILSPEKKASSVSPENIPNTCSKCHESEKMKKYDISSDHLKTYNESYHGVAHELGSLQVANCSSCHGFHDIRPSSDPKSSINVNNLQKTCGKCHTKTSVNFTRGKIHLNIESKGSGLFYYIRQAFIWVFAVLVGISVIWFAADVRRRLKEKRRR